MKPYGVKPERTDSWRGFYRAVEKLAEVEHFPGLSGEDRDWRDKAETLAAGELRALGRRPDGEALAALVEQVGPNARQLSAEAQKLASYVGDRESVTVADVVVTQAQASAPAWTQRGRYLVGRAGFRHPAVSAGDAIA